MLNKFFNSLFPVVNMVKDQMSHYEMRTMAKVENITIIARFSNEEWQRMGDDIFENRIHRDGTRTPHACLMPNCHSVYFEYMVNGNYNKRVGFSNRVNFGTNREKAIQDYVDQVLVPRAKEKAKHYTDLFNKKDL